MAVRIVLGPCATDVVNLTLRGPEVSVLLGRRVRGHMPNYYKVDGVPDIVAVCRPTARQYRRERLDLGILAAPYSSGSVEDPVYPLEQRGRSRSRRV